MTSSARRAPPLSPDARRASIIAAALPLLRTHGTAVTTAQIAAAAGIAEGTLFRAFPDKDSLIQAAICSAFDPAPVDRELAAIDPGLGLRQRLIRAVEILTQRVEAIWQLISILGVMPPGPGALPAAPRTDTTQAALAALFEPARGELRCDPAQAARLLRTMTFAGTHPRISEGNPLSPDEVVSVLLDGIVARRESQRPASADSSVEVAC